MNGVNVSQIKPPFLISPYHCSNWFPFAAIVSENELVIGVIPTPKRAIAWTTGVIALFFLGFVWLMFVYGHEAMDVWIAVAIGLMTTVGLPLLIHFKFDSERKHGPVLSYKFGDGFFWLLRQHRQISLGKIDFIAAVTAHDGSSDWCSQLQVHTKDGARWLLATGWTKHDLIPLLGKIQEHINVPVKFLKQKSRNELQEEK
ncbi:MAG: hypothetical protein RL616_397 [Verrucomicrobiota bacterium]